MDGRPISVDTRKAMAIVALVAAEGRPFARDELAAMFWPDADDESARGALRRTLSALRSAVGDPGLIIERTRVAIDVARTDVDLSSVERLATSERISDLESAVGLIRGPFLAGFALRDSPAFDDWQAATAARTERLFGNLYERLAAARFSGGDVNGAIEAARRRVDLDPLDELGQRRLIELLALAGDRTGAIRQYRELVALFDRELGVAPLRETSELYDSVREGRLTDERSRVVVATSAEASVASDGSAIPAATVTPIIGRERELSMIRSAWNGAVVDGRIVMLEGEVGIGKTRLGDAAAATIRAGGSNVLAARGYQGEGAIAYGPIAQLLQAGIADPDGLKRLASLDPTARGELGRLISLPAPLRVGGATGASSVDRASAKVRLLDAIVVALSVLVSGQTPGLIWIDDLHLADDPTREAIEYLAHRLAGRPMLLLVAWRREDLTAGGEATAADLASLPSSTHITLGRLERNDIAAMLRATRPDEDPADDLIDALAADSEGVPLHVVAALASADPTSGSMPRGINALLRERVGSVSETAAQILTAAAVIGRSFDLATVRAASGRSEEETVEAMDEVVRRGLVREMPEGAALSVRYDFAHGRIRDVVYEATSQARRRLLHRRIAEALRLSHGVSSLDDLARHALIARHERAAGRPEEAAEAFVEAADRAEAVFANQEAIDFLAAAIALGYVGRPLLHARIGELHARLGEYPAAITALETAAALAQGTDLPEIEITLGRVHRRRGDLMAAASHLDAVLATGAIPDVLRAAALAERTVVALRAGELDSAATLSAEALAAADRVGDPHLRGRAERLVGLVAQARGDLAGARDALERSLQLAADDPDPTAWIAANAAMSLTLGAAGATDDAVTDATRAIDACRRIGDRHLEAAVENHLADILHGSGRQEESMEHLKRAVALFAEIGEGEPEPDPGIWTFAAW